MKNLTILLAFGYGLASFLSACVLPLIPVYLSSLVGADIFEEKSKRPKLPIFRHALSFVIGFSITFTLFGLGSGLLGSFLQNHLIVVRKVAGVILVLLGLVMLAALKVPWLNFESRLKLNLPKGGGYWRSFLSGAVFPVAWIPCTSFVLGGILTLASTSGTAWQGAFLLFVYSMGLGLPFLILGAAFDFVMPLLKSLKRYSAWVYLFSGLLLVVMGILIFSGNLSLLPGQI
jgi:cytochrome c-type biogenesis protein